jgi:tetratricopeptide (TPR) repeat protein
MILAGFGLVLLVVIAYLPMFKGGFIWDDVDNVINNPHLRSLGGLKKIWLTRGAGQQYFPLAFTSYWIDFHLWGLNPIGYHAENILLHGLAVVLLWRVLALLKAPGAWLGAALFALHPVCVESVSWVTERRNMLSAVFILASVWAAMKFWLPALGGKTAATSSEITDEKTDGFPGPYFYYLLALGLYVCALWSKTGAVGAPVIILLLVWWKRGDLSWRSLRLFIPFLMAGLMMALITIHIERRIGGSEAGWHLSFLQHCFLAVRVAWFYLGKLLWPHPLMVIYPRGDAETRWLVGWAILGGTAMCLWLLWRNRNGWGRPVLAAAGCFAVMLFPLMGFFNTSFFRFSFVSDHFQYPACMAPLALAGAGIWLATKHSTVISRGVCVLVAGLLGILAWQQQGVYLTDETLWQAAARDNPEAWVAQNNVGLMLAYQGKLDEAMKHLDEALRIKPDCTDALNNEGLVLVRKGEIDRAIGRYAAAVKIDPAYVPAQYNLGDALLNKGSFAEAAAHFVKCRELIPGDYRVELGLGRALAGEGNIDEAVGHFNQTLALNPNYGAAYKEKGLALAQKGDLQSAGDCVTTAARLDPNDADTRFNLGVICVRMGRSAEAIEQYKETLRLSPQMWGAMNNLAWILASDPDPQIRDGTEAVQLAQQACQLTDNRQAIVLGTLGAAYAEAGRFDDAVKAAKQAEALATSVGQKEVAEKNRQMAELFAGKHAFHQPQAKSESNPATGAL